MNATTYAESPPLAKIEQKRLSKPAHLTGRSPRARLRVALRDGLDAAEEDVRETLKGEAECDAGRVFSHAQVMAEVRAIIDPKNRS